ncbi:MAG: uracil-xanthine permease family protein, partial [Candidatus Fimenecus sp.]
MKLIYDIGDRPKFSKTIVFAFQQMIAIMAATLLVPILMSNYKMSNGQTLIFDPAAALFGAGIGTLVYIVCTKRKSPVFLGSSFTFLGAYEAIIGMNYGYWGVLIGIAFAGLVYVVLAIIIKLVGSKWVNKLMPAVIIGPIVTLIGLSLSGTATGWMAGNGDPEGYSLLTILVGAVTFLAIVLVSVKGSKTLRLIPFIIGVGAGYILALVFTLIGIVADVPSLQILSFDAFKEAFVPFGLTSIVDYPKFTFLKAITEHPEGVLPINAAALGNIAMTFVPIAVVELAQHIADHKNLGSIINRDLITEPGLDKTLVGDGLGSIVGGLFGGAANTTYGESIGCVAITGNASIVSIVTASFGCMLLSFITPFVALINSIPKCVMGGACVALYGFIAVSGLQMLKKVDLGNNKNLFVVSAILVTGIGGLALNFGTNSATNDPLLTITSLATALIFGIITNLVVNGGK